MTQKTKPKFKFTKKIVILASFLGFFILGSVGVWAWSQLTGFRVDHGGGETYAESVSYCKKVTNSHASNDYFIPTKTDAEFIAFQNAASGLGMTVEDLPECKTCAGDGTAANLADGTSCSSGVCQSGICTLLSLRSGLVGYWPLDSDTNDYSGNELNGINNGATNTSSGKVGGAYNFDGTSNGIYTPNTNEFVSSNGFTWSIWIKSNNIESNLSQKSLLRYADSTSCEDIGLHFGNSFDSDWDTLVFQVDEAGGCGSAQDKLPVTYTLTGGFKNDTWYYITAVRDYDNNLSKIYLNGIEVASTTNTRSPITESLPFDIGRSWDRFYAPGAWFDGDIDEVAVWDRTLSAAEISMLYNEGNGLSLKLTDGLIGYWPLDDDTNDYSGNGNDAVNDRVTAGVEGKIGTAYDFSGVDDTEVGGFSSDFNTYINSVDEFTLSAWVWDNKILDGNSYTNMGVMGKTTYSNDRFNFYHNASDVSCGMVCDNNSSISLTYNQGISYAWEMMTCTHKPGVGASMYVNGVLVDSTTDSCSALRDSSVGFVIGDMGYNAYYSFKGKIDEVSIWERALSAAEISMLYNGGNGMSLK